MKCDYCWHTSSYEKCTIRHFTETTPSGLVVRRYICNTCDALPVEKRSVPVAITTQQAHYCFQQFARICADNERGISPADIDHSALLSRLLSGEEPLPKPPPLRFSYPDYALGYGKEVEIHSPPRNDSLGTVDLISIDQHRDWQWLDESKGLLKHTLTGDTYRYHQRKASRQTFFGVPKGQPPRMEEYTGHFLQKVQDGTDKPSDGTCDENDAHKSG